MATWPSMLPSASSPSGYGLAPQSKNVRTQMEIGPARVRRRTRSAPVSVDVQFIFTQQEMAIFEAWFEHEIDNGAAWFSAPYFNGSGLTTVEARFVEEEEPYRARMAGPLEFSVTARWEVRNAPVMSASELDAILNPPEP